MYPWGVVVIFNVFLFYTLLFTVILIVKFDHIHFIVKFDYFYSFIFRIHKHFFISYVVLLQKLSYCMHTKITRRAENYRIDSRVHDFNYNHSGMLRGQIGEECSWSRSCPVDDLSAQSFVIELGSFSRSPRRSDTYSDRLLFVTLRNSLFPVLILLLSWRITSACRHRRFVPRKHSERIALLFSS